MAAGTSFGRRNAGGPSRPPAPSRPRAEAAAGDPHALSPAAEAFRAELKVVGAPPRSEFQQWRRGQTGRRLFAWALGLALMAPGVLSFVLDLPLELSAALEVAGLIGAWWLRRERRRQLNAIATWDAPAAERAPATSLP